MDLVLWRHAEAEPGEPDLGRRLTPKGQRDAERIARWLDRYLPDTARILVSPAARAQETAAALGRRFKTVARLAPGAGATDVLAAANWPGSREVVLVVGHQPTLGAVAALLLAGASAEWSVKKAGVWWLTDRVRGESAKVVLRVAISPDFV